VNDINVGSFLRIAWWTWFGLMIATVIGGVIWYLLDNTVEPALVVVTTIAALLLEIVGFLKAWRDRHEKLQDKADVIQATRDESELTRQTMLEKFEETHHIIRQEKQQIPVIVESYISNTHREADLELLAEIWQVINSDRVKHLDDSLQQGVLRDDFYQTFQTYVLKKMNVPEYDFLGLHVKKHFDLFDESLTQLDRQLIQSHGVEDFQGQLTLRPDYKQKFLAWKVRKYKEKEYDKTIDMLLEMREKHRELVKFLRQEFPEFKFR
jgi:hypothetical protein